MANLFNPFTTMVLAMLHIYVQSSAEDCQRYVFVSIDNITCSNGVIKGELNSRYVAECVALSTSMSTNLSWYVDGVEQNTTQSRQQISKSSDGHNLHMEESYLDFVVASRKGTEVQCCGASVDDEADCRGTSCTSCWFDVLSETPDKLHSLVTTVPTEAPPTTPRDDTVIFVAVTVGSLALLTFIVACWQYLRHDDPIRQRAEPATHTSHLPPIARTVSVVLPNTVSFVYNESCIELPPTYDDALDIEDTDPPPTYEEQEDDFEAVTIGVGRSEEEIEQEDEEEPQEQNNNLQEVTTDI